MDEREINEIVESRHLDELTGLHNLTGVLDHLQGHGDFSASEKSIIVYLNVMNFKAFNQRYGFLGGNQYLKGLAEEIQSIFKEELVARTSGDQFIIIANSLDEKKILKKLSDLRAAAVKYQKGLVMRIKAGIYKADGTEKDPVVMVDRAKIACDDIIRVYDKDDNIYSEELNKKNELRQYVIDNFEIAFKKKYFKVYYQKEVRALTGKVCGYEALARWNDPKYGIISPGTFVEVLENVRLIHKLDIYMIEQVCSDLRDDIDSGFAVEPISINLSRLDFELCDIKAEIDRCRKIYNIPKNLLNIEITESALTSEDNFLGEQIKKLRRSGYQIWMDDFGTGYSSFGNLKSYDYDMIKIDMSFIREYEKNKKTRVILAAIISMAKELGIHTLAEGVETKEQYEFLRRIGCEKLQGYLFGTPKPVESFVREEDCSFENCEDFAYHLYYDSMGDINFLGSTPLRPKKMNVFNTVPIGIYEMEGDRITFIYINDAYKNFLSSIGVASMKQANKRNRNVEIPEVRKIVEASHNAEKARDKRGEIDAIVNGCVINSKVRFLSRQGNKSAFAIVSRNVTLHSDDKKSENIQVAMAHVFNQYFRVDLYDQGGTVENIFLNSDQLAIADKEMDAKEAVKIYSDKYLIKKDRARFRKFYDISTVHDRLKATGGDYLVDYYHSAVSTDKGRMQMYMILPFYYNGRWKYISCCRFADEIDDEHLY
ncbi:diguanylate cyclase (GGDEF) domain-containing protein [Butyrivibrio sp. INlla18]|uniref:GGDEF domain-containing phosphodiesterase n=1 Tax=Butyrivibrio sp. INlla18 TaxID=1520806 RepID=UPI000884ACC0|nr:GGDEF domain-containing phosphodiesterase [Butyrivibrio sp. INlla18]SDA54135.1 diguanylate cyclase (GGDEF) domain-containing protein [Butyrivibrio sp. INlla18]